MSGGGEPDFDDTFRRLYPLAYRRAFRRVANGSDAEEIALDVLTALARRWPRLAGHENLEAWINIAIDHRVRDYWRKAFRRRGKWDALVAQLQVSEDDDIGPLIDRLSADRYLESLGRVIRGLNNLDREMLILHFVNGYSAREIRHKLGLTDVQTESINRRLARILIRVRRLWLEDTA